VGWVDSGWSILQTVSSATQLIGFISQVVESKCYVRSVDTQDQRDLVGVYDYLLGNETCDSFEDSGEAVAAFEAAEILVRSAKYHKQRTLLRFASSVMYLSSTRYSDRYDTHVGVAREQRTTRFIRNRRKPAFRSPCRQGKEIKIEVQRIASINHPEIEISL